ncbi:hotdog fold thioesterase [Phaeodactylibacter luteus]|uniref:Hotdog fold thioesterase n=1 Tax=Phaeodactylibacter luteus TaxID=1564516 RepID=A0A5C6S1E6_9BACT|nr:hotdog fold thioesterase [Phaeodactylibacter luteus]TXB68361.1 hotdog fold thioesterase [Phaeodactylibacter luteus]
MDGKERARRVYEQMMAKDYCSQWMGIVPLQLEEGRCQIRMQVKREMLNGYGILHGGIAFAFADSAFAFASNSFGRVAVSIQGSMNYARPVREGEVLVAEAKALNVGYKTADFDVEVRNEAGEVCYFFRGTVYRSSKSVLPEDRELL